MHFLARPPPSRLRHHFFLFFRFSPALLSLARSPVPKTETETKNQVEEFYVLTWENPGAEVPFEMPTGGTAIMRAGANLLKLARKEQALALLTQLKAKNKVKVGNIYRLLPSGETQHLHPKDGTVPERVNAGRAPANTNARRIGDNKDPAQIKFTGKLGAFDL
jgi:photosystem I subunit 2